ncbi:aminotransferase class IV [Conexibacter sp. JD483]|uniref:aminotransferase class IV n=1 Tax=unclassified Conexibacter TaxID=2627773 RepID=UPI002721FBA6|nr:MULTISPECIES: aminotransferase class IV [unclassified Conexibacter]MDO8184412.1 aminotransferase class IV [Conexibacter sp. CPCC 205706]MDO8197718.1 aminotransferase class IV [Conexibacter sp. CPCC 205762]MDR9368146.1 aminotransferase class IV [Conexibacter sp. JD483]
MSSALLACLDGVVLPAAEARIPATDDGLLQGDGVSELLRLHGGRPVALADHLARLERSAAGLRLPLDLDAVHTDVAELLTAAGTGPEHGLLRIVVTRGGRRLLLTEPAPPAPAQVRLATVTYAPPRLLDGIGALGAAGQALASRQARERGFDAALLVTPHGRALESPAGALFWVAGGRLLTTPLDDHVADGVMRARVIALSGAQQQPIALDRLKRADELLLATTAFGIVPVVGVDDAELAVGAVTRDLAARVGEQIRDELRER